MLLVEGSDSLGKTTAIKRMLEIAPKVLGEDLPFFYSHMGPPEPGFNFSTHYLDRMQKYAIQDRFHWGALVYQEDKIDDFTLKWIDAYLTLQGSFTVLVICNHDCDWYRTKLEAELNTRNQIYSVDRLVEANETFADLWREDIIRPDVTWCVNSDDSYPNDSDFEYALKEWRKRSLLLWKYRTFND